jgi:hypothetical protein
MQFSPSLGEASGDFDVLIRTPARFSNYYGLPPSPAAMAGRLLISSQTRRSPKGEVGPGKGTMLPRATTAFTSTGKPDDFAVLCQLVVPYRPSMRFLSIGSRV